MLKYLKGEIHYYFSMHLVSVSCDICNLLLSQGNKMICLTASIPSVAACNVCLLFQIAQLSQKLALTNLARSQIKQSSAIVDPGSVYQTEKALKPTVIGEDLKPRYGQNSYNQNVYNLSTLFNHQFINAAPFTIHQFIIFGFLYYLVQSYLGVYLSFLC